MKRPEEVLVWDPLLRLFHWLLVLSFIIAWYSQEAHYEIHIGSGYSILGLVCFRLLWGFVGPTHARFSDFVKRPLDLLAYAHSLGNRSARRYLGHNPAGGFMILLFLLVLSTVTVSGIALDGAENWSGPLADMGLFLYKETIHQLHEWGTDTLLMLILLHLLGVIHACFLHRENLIKAMFNGYKRA